MITKKLALLFWVGLLSATTAFSATTLSEINSFLTDSSTIHAMKVVGDYAYVAADTDGLRIVDLRSSTPQEVGFFDTPGHARDLLVYGNYVYVADYEEGIRVIDVSNPTAPVEIASATQPGTRITCLVANGSFIEAGSDAPGFSGIYRFVNTYSDPHQLTASAIHFSTAYPVYDIELTYNSSVVPGVYYPFFVAGGDSGIHIISNDNGNGPELGSLDTQNAVELEVAFDQGIAYVADGAGGLRVIDVSDFTAPSQLAQIPSASGVTGLSLGDNVVYLAEGNAGVRAIDVSDPANPVVDAQLGTSASAAGIFSFAHHHYVGGSSGGLRTVLAGRADLSDTEQKVWPADPTHQGWHGADVAIDGNYAVVGASGDRPFDPAVPLGSVYVYVHNGTSWALDSKLTASDGVLGDSFGGNVAISANWVVASAMYSDPMGDLSGSVYVFNNNGSWSEQAKLTPSDGAAGDKFGCSVDIDGDYIVVGTAKNAAYVFHYDGSKWVEQAKLIPASPPSTAYENSVAISGDTIVFGLESVADQGSYSGAAYIFRYEGSAWTQQAKLLASDGKAYDRFGDTVDMSGTKVIIGGWEAAYVFSENAVGWQQEAKLGSSGVRDVAIENKHLILGFPARTNKNGYEAGEAHYYIYNGSSWDMKNKLMPYSPLTDVTGNRFGTSVAMTETEVVVGMKGDYFFSIDSGAAFFYKAADSDGDGTPDFHDTCSAPANIEVNNFGNAGELVVSWTKPPEADFSHVHVYRSTVDGQLGTLIGDSLTGIKFTDTGLSSLTTYYYTVRSVNLGYNESTNTDQYAGTTIDSAPPAAPTIISVDDATSGGQLDLSWTNPADADFASVSIYRSTTSGTLGEMVRTGETGTSWSDTGLINGTTYYYTLHAVDINGNESTNTDQGSGTPTALNSNAPGPVTGVNISNPDTGWQLDLNWTNPGDTDFAAVLVYRTTVNCPASPDADQTGELVYAVAEADMVLPWNDTELTNGTTYCYEFHTVDDDGNENLDNTQYSGVPTDGVPPLPVTGLSVTLLDGGIVQLDWTESGSPDRAIYHVYGDNNSGSVDYGTALANGDVNDPTTTWSSGSLNVGVPYQFVVRTEDNAGNVETNTTTVVAIPKTAPGAADVCASIKVPQTGHKIAGNSVTVKADVTCGNPDDVTQVLLRYRTAPAGTWTDIPSTDPVKLPNPSPDKYFVYWNIDAGCPDSCIYPDGDYHLQAVASNLNGPDSAPSYVTVTIDHSNPDSAENSNSGQQSKQEKAYKNAPSKSTMGGETGTTGIDVPADALAGDTKINLAEKDPKDAPDTTGFGNSGAFRDIAFDNGQSELNNGKKAEVVIPYKDDNNDGIVDGSDPPINIYDLQLCNYHDGEWICLDSTIDTKTKTIKGKSGKFSTYGLLVPPKPVGDNWAMVSVPFTPSGTACSVFCANNQYGSYITWYDPTISDYNRMGTVEAGKSYWILGNGTDISATGTETQQSNFSISLKKGWNMIGHPFRYQVNLSDVEVTYNAQTVSLLQAETNGWVIGTLFDFDNGAYQTRTVQDGGKLEAWKGFWILSDVDCELVIPPTPAQ